jgi:ferredoxin--NADP+ reductase
MSTWVEGRVAGKRRWKEGLFSLTLDAPDVTFTAGQFGRLALPAPADAKEPMLGRPYSFVNPPGAPLHEFYFNVVPAGPFSPRLALLEPGDALWIAPRANGFFCIGETPPAEAMWCLSTGSGLGPFLSILRTAEAWEKYRKIVLVHAARTGADLAYPEVMAELAQRHGAAFAYVPVVSREAHAGALHGRIPALVADGTLEARADVALAADNAHAMLCGNPAMVDDVQAVLATRGMRRHRRREPGHITLETYW